MIANFQITNGSKLGLEANNDWHDIIKTRFDGVN